MPRSAKNRGIHGRSGGLGDGGSTPSTGAHPVGANAYRVNQPDVPGPKYRGPVTATALRSVPVVLNLVDPLRPRGRIGSGN
jgi:hypothetical protein